MSSEPSSVRHLRVVPPAGETANALPEVALPEGALPEVVYRRRRFGVCVAGLGAMIVLTLFFSQVAQSLGGRAGVGDGSASSAPAVIVVEQGDTVWSIARGLTPSGDVRVTVDSLIAVNGGPTLQVGQRFLVDGEGQFAHG